MKFKKYATLLITCLISFQSLASSSYYIRAVATDVKVNDVYINSPIDMVSIYENFYTSATSFYGEKDRELNFFSSSYSQRPGRTMTVSFDLKTPVSLSGIKTNWTINSGSSENKWARLIKFYIKDSSGSYILVKTLNRNQKIQEFIFEEPLQETKGIKIILSGSEDYYSYQGFQQIIFYEKKT